METSLGPVDEHESRRGSDVLDAIWDKVAAKPERSDAASSLFRAKALAQLDVAAEVDNQLPLVSRRSWLLLAGAAVLVAAFGLWASLTPSVTSVSGPGRIVAAPGALPVATTVDGVLQATAEAGDALAAGDPAAVVTLPNGSTAPVPAPVAGTVWQLPLLPGTVVRAGDVLATLLPEGSADSAQLVLPEAQAVAVQPGMQASIGGAQGTVASVGAPLPADEAGARVGMALPPGTDYVLVTIALASELPEGQLVNGQVILSDGTVITRLLGR